jgi:DNA-binding FadR family transcriptional regulator
LMTLIRHMRRDASGEAASAVPIGDFAEQFSASRGTVRNLLQLAQMQGWLTLKTRGGREVALSESFVDQAERWVALELEWAGEFAALATVERLARRFD